MNVPWSGLCWNKRNLCFNFNSKISSKLHILRSQVDFSFGFCVKSPTWPGGWLSEKDWPDDVTFSGSQFRSGPFVAFPKWLKWTICSVLSGDFTCCRRSETGRGRWFIYCYVCMHFNIVCMHYVSNLRQSRRFGVNFQIFGADILVVFIIFFNKKCWNHENNGRFLLFTCLFMDSRWNKHFPILFF
jgi:hypothetical protein